MRIDDLEKILKLRKCMAKTQTNAAEEHDGDDEFSGEVSSMLTFKLIDEQYLNSCFFFRRKK